MDFIKIIKQDKDSFQVWIDDAIVRPFHISVTKEMMQYIISMAAKLKSLEKVPQPASQMDAKEAFKMIKSCRDFTCDYSAKESKKIALHLCKEINKILPGYSDLVIAEIKKIDNKTML